MSWHYSQAQAVDFSLADYLAGVPLLPSRLTHTHESECCNGSARDTWTPFQSGTMFGHSTGDLFGAESPSSAADSPAKTSLLLGRVLALPERVRDFGSSICGSLERLGHAWSLPKTPRTCVPTGSAPLFMDLPSWGMTADGACWELPTLERRTEDSECGSWPTPTVCDRPTEGNVRLLRERVLDGTITHEDAAAILGKSPMKAQGKYPEMVGMEPIQPTRRAGLNPDWAEWLMGWPIGWTDSAALETDRFQEWLQRHSGFCQRD